MLIKPILSSRRVFVGAISIIILGIAAFALGERSYSSVLIGLFTAEAAEQTSGGQSQPMSDSHQGTAAEKKANRAPRPGTVGTDRLIFGQGERPLLDAARVDKIRMLTPSGTTQVLSELSDFEPSLSPDGKKIVFVTTRNGSPTTNPFTRRGQQELYIMNADGSDQRRLRSTAPGGKAQPSFSPDGQSIVFVSGDNNIYIRNLATGVETQLNTLGCVASLAENGEEKAERETNNAFPGVFGPDTPNYSPDGAYILFGRNNSGRRLWRVEANGSGSCQLMHTGPSSRAGTGRYSPDGTKIAVMTHAADPNEEWFYDLAILDATTGAIIAQYAAPNFYQSPVWSPDGTKIAYPAAEVDFTQFEMRVGRAIRTFNLQTQQMEEIYVSGSPEGIHGMTWGTPTSVVPPISLRINSPHPLTAGQSTTATVYLASPAPAGGQPVSLSMTNGVAGTITFPSPNIVVPEGESQATFTIESPLDLTYRSADVLADAGALGSAQATVSLKPATPDLRAVSFTSPASTAPAVSFAVSWTVDNIGPVSTGANGGTDLVYFSLNDQWENNVDQQIQSVYASAPLAPGGSRTVNSSATIPANRVPGSGQYYLIFCTNPFGDQPWEDGQLANNCRANSIQVNMPDLIADTVVAPSTTEPLTSYNVSWVVRNIGAANAGASATQLFFSNDSTAGNSDDVFLAGISTAAIASGGSIAQNRNVSIPTLPVRPSGGAFFYVKVDANSAVTEGPAGSPGESNNTTFANTQFDYNVADLQVTDSSSAAEVETDTVIPFSWTTANVGTRAAGTFSERVYFSNNNTVGGDVLLGTFALTGGLGTGAFVERIQNVTIPTSAITASGDYFLYVQTDYLNAVDEGVNENNNIRFHPVTVRRKMRPDLVVTNITAPPMAFFDQAIQVQWTVTNSGTGPTNAAAWKDRVNMNTTGSNTSGTRLIDVDSISALAPGESYVASATVRVPRGYNGSYQIVVTTDINGALNEENTTNNKLTRPITLNVPPLPDLTVSNVQAPEQAFAGGPINVSWQVNNIGNAAAQGDNQALNKPWSWSDRVYLSRDTVLNTSQDRLIHTRVSRSTPLAAGASYSMNTYVATSTGGDYVKLPHNVEGLYYVFVLTDYSNTIYEFNAENNNSAYDEIGPVGSPINIIMTPPDLVINAQPAGPANASGGQAIDISFTVANQGAFTTAGSWTDAIYLSTDQTFGDDTILGTKSNSSIGPGGSRVVEMRVTLPQCVTTGNYYLIARTDTGNVVAEFDPGYDAEANNNSPAKAIQITTLPPDLVASNIQYSPINLPGQSVTVTWNESNIGTGPGPYQWVDRIVLKSLDGFGSVELGRVTQQGVIPAGQSVARSRNVTLPSFMQGQYVITIQTDYSRNAPECGAALNNNSADSAAFAVSNNLPDLVVDSVTAPGVSVAVGADFQVDYTARNNGGQLSTVTGWRDYVYLSSNQTLSSGDRFLGSVAMTSNLAPGETYTRSLTVNSGNVPAGQYYLLVKSDGDSKVYEGPTGSLYEQNNVQASIPVTFSSPGVDLQAVVNSVGTPIYSGMSTIVNWTVTNTGTAQTLSNNWTDYIILSRDSIIDPTDRILGYAVREQVLAGGASYTTSRAVSIPAGLTDLYRIFVITDYSNRIVEDNDGNNTSPGFNVTLQLPPPADLNVTNITVPAGGTPGAGTIFQWTTQNSGAFPAVGPWRDSVYLSRDQFWDAGDYLLGQRERTGSPLNVSQTEQASWGVTIPMIAEGDYYVIVRLDSQNRVRETDEGNNVSVSVSQVPITVQSLTMNTPFMTQLLNGSTKSFKFDPPADETVLVSLTGEEGNSNELFTNFFSAASRADYDFQGSGERTDDQENFIPNTETGRYYTMVSHDYIPPQDVLFDKQPEKIVNGQIGTVPVPPQNITISANILPFSVHRVSPTTAGNKGIATLTLKGAKFQNGLTARLERAGSTPLIPIHLKNTSTHIVAVFDLADATPGQYDVVVTNPDMQTTTVTNGFEIVNGGGYSLTKSIIGPSGFRLGQTQVRMTFSVKNSGLNDALFVPVIISFSTSISYQIDPKNYVELPPDMLPSNAVAQDLIPHRDINGKRYLMLMIPLLRSRTSWDVGINLSGLSSSSVPLGMAALPSLNEITNPSGQPTPETVAAMRDLAPGMTTGECMAEFTRQMFFLLTDLIPGTGCADEAISAHASIIGYVSGIVAADIMDKDPADAAFGGSMAQVIVNLAKNVVECVGGELPWVKYANFVWNLYNLYQLMKDCPNDEDLKWILSFFMSFDPNEKLGPAGFGTEGFVPVGTGMLYRINFENLPTAGGPAQKIIITDQLPPTLDPRTVRLREIGFKQNVVTVPDNQAFYQARLQLGPDLNNLFADISAGLDIVNGRVTWTLSAIDPQTGEAPLDPEAGLLPPNNENHDGEGFVTFTVQPKATYPNRTLINNSATITFDVNEPIVTNSTANMLDSVVPASTMTAMPAYSTSPAIPFAWNGTDDADGSGFDQCEIRMSTDGGAYVPILVAETLVGNSAYAGVWGKHYAFQSICSDHAGNVEVAPITADAETTVLGGDTEGDLAPRPNGNDGLLSADDTDQVRRFVAGLDTDFTYNEFQRSDMSPRDGGGNGTLSVADIMQARRYVAVLDAKADAAGPNQPSGMAPKTVPGKKSAMLPREIKAERITRIGNQLHVGIRLEAQGDETGVGFGLNFDPAVLSGPVATLGADGGGAVLTLNNADVAAGRIGVLIDKAPASPFAAGSRHVLTVVFTVAPGATAPTQITLGSDPIVAEVVDGLAASLTTTFSPSMISLQQPTSAGVNVSGTVYRHNGTPLRNARVTITDPSGTSRSSLTNAFGLFRLEDIAAGQNYTISVRAKGYVFAPRVLNVSDEVTGLEFSPEP